MVARQLLTTTNQTVVYDCLVQELLDLKVASEIDGYLLATYVTTTLQLQELNERYSPVEDAVSTVLSISDQGTQDRDMLNPLQTVWKHLTDRQASLAKQLGLDPLTRTKLREQQERVEALRLGQDIARERAQHQRVDARMKAEIDKAKLKLLSENSIAGERRAERKLDMLEAKDERAAILEAEHLVLKKEIVAMKKEQLELKREETQVRLQLAKDRADSDKPKELPENAVTRLMKANSGRRRQLALKPAKGKKESA